LADSDFTPATLTTESAPDAATLAPPPPTLRALFFGDDGLRAGWSVLLFVMLSVLLRIAMNAVIKHFPPAATPDAMESLPRFAAIGEALRFTYIVIPALLMSAIERRPFARYGITPARMLPDYFTGLFWGFVSLSALIGGLYLTHSIGFDGLLLHGATALLYALKWGFVFLLVGLFEEFFFRGYLQYTVARGVAGITRTMDPQNRHSHAIGFWVSATIFSILIFMLAHLGNGGETAAGIVAVGLAGVVFAFSLWRTGSLWWGIGMHTSWDWAQSYFYGTPDSGTISQGHLIATHPIGAKFLSGGPDGPEGSVLVIPALLLVALVIHLTLPRRNYPLTPDQRPPAEPVPATPAI
jgi:uncharacterized protein